MPQENTTAVLMLCVTIPRDRTTVHVNLDILGMDGLAKVAANVSSFLNGVIYVIYIAHVKPYPIPRSFVPANSRTRTKQGL